MSNKIYGKFINSKFNLMQIKPQNSAINVYNYYLGVFMKNYDIKLDGVELIEVMQAPSGSRIEDYYPLIIEALNKRGNWQCLTTNEAQKYYVLDFAFSNATSIVSKAYANYRFLLNSNIHYISNKADFYNTFAKYNFIPQYESVNKDNILNMTAILEDKFTDKKIILKPDKGSVSSGIVVLDKFNITSVNEHILNNKYYGWTISEVFIPKLYDGYIVSNRIYFLVVKINNSIIKSYFCSEFMNYRAMEKFKGNIQNKEEFLTNYMDPEDPNADEIFVRTRFIPHEDWLNSYPQYIQNKIYDQLGKIFHTITETIKDDLVCHNDNININKDLETKPIIGFHIYGVDALIDSQGIIKIIEINGAPAFNVKTKYYNIPNRIDYFDLMEEIVQKTIDIIYPPLYPQTPINKFIQVYDGEKNSQKIHNSANLPLKLYYIPKSVISMYSFIYEALNSRKYLTRTKNMFDKIDVFYGLRERYIVPESSMNYYDELINYKMSPRMRNAKIINKIQGITYYLASKDGLYKKLINKYGHKITHSIHPESILVYYDSSYESLREIIRNEIHHYKSIDKWIVKPVHGSRGLGIKIFHKSFSLAEQIANFIIESSEKGFILTKKTNQYTFDGKELIINEIKNYKYWMISKYIDNPHLLTAKHHKILDLSYKSQIQYSKLILQKPSILGKKYNIRFYVLITLDKLPTFADLDTFNKDKMYDIINVYLYSDYMVYFSMLKYYKNDIPEIYQNLDPKILDDMKNLTNLEIVNIINGLFLDKGIPYDPIQIKKDITCMFSDIYPKDSNEFNAIKLQIINIVKKTINSIKYDLRPLNRHENYKSCFNLLAFDSMLDDNGKLWIIEINRGPDMVGLRYNIGEVGCFNMFDEIFTLSIDKFYSESVVNNVKNFEKIKIKYNIVNNSNFYHN